MHWWHVGVAANTIAAVAYVAIFWSIVRGLIRSDQWKANRLAVATALIFLTAGAHHALLSAQQLALWGSASASGEAGRRSLDTWYLSSWDLVTAVVAAWYWTLRGRLPVLVRGASLFEDLRERQRQALEIHDDVIQGLATAKLAIELGDSARAMVALEQSLVSTRAIITNLLGPDAPLMSSGQLRHNSPATESS